MRAELVKQNNDGVCFSSEWMMTTSHMPEVSLSGDKDRCKCRCR